MAVSEWSTNPVNNTHINGYSLSGPYGHVFAVMMAELKAELDSMKAADESAGEAIEALETAMGSWTDATETTAVKPAIEALRPAGE